MTHGITESDVQKRRAMFGYNELESPTENLLLKFFGFFKGPILYGECARARYVVMWALIFAFFSSHGARRRLGWWFARMD